MIHDQTLLDLLGGFAIERFDGEVFRATGVNADPLASSVNAGRWAPVARNGYEVPILYTSIERDGALAEVVSYLSLLTPLPSSRPLKISRLAASTLFAGSDGGAEHWAVIASLIENCKLIGVEPYSYLADVITRIVASTNCCHGAIPPRPNSGPWPKTTLRMKSRRRIMLELTINGALSAYASGAAPTYDSFGSNPLD